MFRDSGPAELIAAGHSDSREDQERIGRAAWASTHASLFGAGALDVLLSGEATVTWRTGRPWKTCFAYVSDEAVGFTSVALYEEPDELGKPRALVEPMHVLPAFQRNGIGGQLWDWALKEAWKSGVPSLGVWVIRANQPGLAFYGSRPGIRKTGRQGQMIISDVIQAAVEFRLDYRD